MFHTYCLEKIGAIEVDPDEAFSLFGFRRHWVCPICQTCPLQRHSTNLTSSRSDPVREGGKIANGDFQSCYEPIRVNAPQVCCDIKPFAAFSTFFFAFNPDDSIREVKICDSLVKTPLSLIYEMLVGVSLTLIFQYQSNNARSHWFSVSVLILFTLGFAFNFSRSTSFLDVSMQLENKNREFKVLCLNFPVYRFLGFSTKPDSIHYEQPVRRPPIVVIDFQNVVINTDPFCL